MHSFGSIFDIESKRGTGMSNLICKTGKMEKFDHLLFALDILVERVNGKHGMDGQLSVSSHGILI